MLMRHLEHKINLTQSLIGIIINFDSNKNYNYLKVT